MTAAQQVGEDGVGVGAGDGGTSRAGSPSPDVSASSFLRRIESPDGIAPLHSYIDPREAWMAQKICVVALSCRPRARSVVAADLNERRVRRAMVAARLAMVAARLAMVVARLWVGLVAPA